jgi:hypothetical protein
MIKATEDFPVYINGELVHLKEGDEVCCDDQLGQHLINSGRCERVSDKKAEAPKEEVKVEAVEEVKVEAKAEKKTSRKSSKAKK